MEKNNDNFSEIYDGMNAVYSKVEDLMGSAYNKVKNNPNDEDALRLLNELNEIAQSLLYIQMEIVKTYCDKTIINRLIGAIEDKVESLSTIKYN